MKNRSRTYKGGEDGNTNTPAKKGFFGGLFEKNDNDGDKNVLEKLSSGATATFQKTTGYGENPGAKINNDLKEAKTDYDNAVQEINKKLEEDRNKSKSQIVELEEKAQAATTKAKTDYDEKIKELEEKKNEELAKAKQTAAALSQPQTMGGGKRARKSRRKVRKTKRNNKKVRISRKKKHHKKSSRRHRK